MHPLVADAAEGRLPEWAEASAKRRKHVQRVADLMSRWAEALDLDERDCARWRAAGILHDALHDAEFEDIRPLVGPDVRDWPGKMLHGPAAASRLSDEGVDDRSLLLAITWHTVGHRDFDRLGKALYMADYLEPGREYESDRQGLRRARVPRELDTVLREVAIDRIARSMRKGRPLLEPTVRFWNAMADA